MSTETKTKVVSFSEIYCYQTCSLKHRFLYIDKLESKETDQALVLGNTIHRAIESCLKKYKATDKLMNIIELQETYASFLRSKAQEKRIRYKEGWSFDRMVRMGQNMLSFWLRSFKRNYGAILSMEIEKAFLVSLPDPTTNEPTDYYIKGTIDALFHLRKIPTHTYLPDELTDRFFGNHSYAIIDWKTYLNTPNFVSLERCLQNVIYTYGALQYGLIPDIERTACFLGVLHKTKTPIFRVYKTPVTKNLIRQALKIVHETILAMELGFATPHYNPIICPNCDYYNTLCQTEF